MCGLTVMNSSWGSQFNLIEKQGPGAVWVLVFIPTILPLWPWSLDSKPYSQALIISFPNLHDGIRHPTALPQKPVSMVNSVFPSTGQLHSENPNLTSATHKLPGCPGQVSSCPGVIFPNQECKVVSLNDFWAFSRCIGPTSPPVTQTGDHGPAEIITHRWESTVWEAGRNQGMSSVTSPGDNSEHSHTDPI